LLDQGAEGPIAGLEAVLAAVRDVSGMPRQPTVTAAKEWLRQGGWPAMASRIARLSKHRNAAAHPDVTLETDIRRIDLVGKVASHAGLGDDNDTVSSVPSSLGDGVDGFEVRRSPEASEDAVHVDNAFGSDGEKDVSLCNTEGPGGGARALPELLNHGPRGSWPPEPAEAAAAVQGRGDEEPTNINWELLRDGCTAILGVLNKFHAECPEPSGLSSSAADVGAELGRGSQPAVNDNQFAGGATSGIAEKATPHRTGGTMLDNAGIVGGTGTAGGVERRPHSPCGCIEEPCTLRGRHGSC